MDGAWIFILAVLAVAAFAIGGWYWRKKRREAFSLFARRHGLEYSQRDLSGIVTLPFRLFSTGDGRGVENVLSGEWRGSPMKAFDYWYYEESTDSDGNRTKSYYRYTCVLLEVGGVAFPPLSITRENLFTRLADGLGFRDIGFESPDFNKRFQVKGKDRRAAYALIDARMIRWLLTLPGREEFEIAGPWVLAFLRGRRKPVEFAPVIEMALAFRDRVPRAALSMYGRDTTEGAGRPNRGRR